MNWSAYLFDEVKSPDTLQVVFRRVLVFLSTLIILRAGAKRTFGNETSLDKIVLIMLGGMLSRIVTGASAYLPVIAATVAIILVYTGIARLSLYEPFTGFFTGTAKTLFANGKADKKNMKRTLSSEADLYEAARLRLNVEDLSKIRSIVMERNGELSVVKNEE